MYPPEKSDNKEEEEKVSELTVQEIVEDMRKKQETLKIKLQETAKDIYWELDQWENSVYEVFEAAQNSMTGIEIERRKLYMLTNEKYKSLCCLEKKAPICRCGSLIFPRTENPEVKC